jgi:hypothetical protein
MSELIDAQPDRSLARHEVPARGRAGDSTYWRERRQFARRVKKAVSSLSDDELNDWALVYAFSQLQRYRTLANRYAVLYRSVEVTALLLACVVTVLAGLSVQAWVTASTAAAVTFLTGFRQINLLHENWVSCQDACTLLNSLVSEYRTLPAGDRSHDKGQQLVHQADKVVEKRVRIWKHDLQSNASQKTTTAVLPN